MQFEAQPLFSDVSVKFYPLGTAMILAQTLSFSIVLSDNPRCNFQHSEIN